MAQNGSAGILGANTRNEIQDKSSVSLQKRVDRAMLVWRWMRLSCLCAVSDCDRSNRRRTNICVTTSQLDDKLSYRAEIVPARCCHGNADGMSSSEVRLGRRTSLASCIHHATCLAGESLVLPVMMPKRPAPSCQSIDTLEAIGTWQSDNKELRLVQHQSVSRLSTPCGMKTRYWSREPSRLSSAGLFAQ